MLITLTVPSWDHIQTCQPAGIRSPSGRSVSSHERGITGSNQSAVLVFSRRVSGLICNVAMPYDIRQGRRRRGGGGMSRSPYFICVTGVPISEISRFIPH